MDFKINIRTLRKACMCMLVMFAWLTENAIAQTTCVVETVFSVNIQSKPTAAFSFMASNLSATFSNSSANATTYAWDFGDPNSGASNTSSQASPVHQFTSAGSYTVTLTATNGCGSRSITQTVQVVCPSLSIAATANGPTQICPGASVQLAATTGYQTYQWQLGGNPIANGNTANFTASQPGQYTVIATDAAGCTGTSQSVSVSMLPLAQPSFSSTASALNAVFVNASTNATSYVWNFGDPNSGAQNTSSVANPTHIFSAPGSYVVTLTALNSCGQQSITQTVQVACPTISVAATANGATQICPGTSVQLAATMGYQTYQWQLGGNPIANGNVANIMASLPGVYTVIATDASGCTGMSQSVSITLLPLAQPSFSATVNAMSAVFANTSTNAMSYLWNFGDPNSGASNTSSETNPTHMFSAPGTYIVTLSATNACGAQNTTQTVSIGCTPPQVSISSGSSVQFCQGGSTLLQTTSANLVAYQWYLNDLPITSATNSSLTAFAGGQYKVLATDAFGCQNFSNVLVVELFTLPSATIASSMGQAVCEGTSLVLTGGSGVDYQWVVPNGATVSGQNIAIPAASISNQGTYRLTVTDGNGCTATAQFQLTVNPLPLVSINGIASTYIQTDPPVPLIGTPVGGIFSGIGVAGNVFNPSTTGIGLHTIYYTYTDTNNCTNMDSIEVQVTQSVAASSIEVVSYMQVLPNPNQGDFRLEIVLSSNRTLNFSVMNALGQTMVNRQERLPSGQSILHFSSHELNSGVYILKVMDGEQYACLRVIVAK